MGIMTLDISTLLQLLFCVVAVGMSIFYGWYACKIHQVEVPKDNVPWLIHQFWFNFLGAAIGWVATWAVLGSVLVCAKDNCPNSISLSSVTLFLVAFIGITGHLPTSLVGLIGGLKEFVDKLLTAIGGKA